MYWTEYYNGRIVQSNLNGSSTSTLLNGLGAPGWFVTPYSM